MDKKREFETEAIRNQIERSGFGEHTSAMYVTSSFVFDDAEDMRASFAEEKEKELPATETEEAVGALFEEEPEDQDKTEMAEGEKIVRINFPLFKPLRDCLFLEQNGFKMRKRRIKSRYDYIYCVKNAYFFLKIYF